MTTWDERFRRGSYPEDPAPSAVLVHYLDAFPPGRALDIATGTGRNALVLAEAGYTVDAIDRSREGLGLTRDRAADAGVAEQLRLIQADIPSFAFPTDRYAVVTISFYRAVDRYPDIKASLIPGGFLFVEHHLRSSDPTPSGPPTDRYRFPANELLHGGLDLTVLYYDETTSETPVGDQRATARLLARNTTGPRQSYPPRWDRSPDRRPSAEDT